MREKVKFPTRIDDKGGVRGRGNFQGGNVNEERSFYEEQSNKFDQVSL